jgi:hypothetical protein
MPIGPMNPPIGPMNPPVGPMNPPMIDPRTGRPVPDPMNPPDPNRPFDPNNPLGKPNESPEQMAKTKAVETATALWEKNVGPIEESPAVKRALIDLVSDPEVLDSLKDGKGDGLFDFLKDADNDGKFGDLFNGGESGWDLPKLDWNLNWGNSNNNLDLPRSNSSNRDRWGSDRPSRWGSSGSSSGLGSFDFGGVQISWLFILILLALIVAAVVWWKWNSLFTPQSALAFAGDGPGGWPLDPRAINTREDVVKAFEYLSVLICGPGAKTWTHSTIADELTVLAATHGETAVKLARLYELARYAPLDEPLTRLELLEARRLVCDLAGVDEV